MSSAPRLTLTHGLAVLIPGVIITALSAGRAAANFESVDVEVSIVPIVVLAVGAVLFAVGTMLTLIVVVRPLFGERPQDARADKRR